MQKGRLKVELTLQTAFQNIYLVLLKNIKQNRQSPS